MKTKMQPFQDTTHDPIAPNQGRGNWGWWVNPPIGEPRWSGDHETKKEAQEARREAIRAAKGSGAVAEWQFWRS